MDSHINNSISVCSCYGLGFFGGASVDTFIQKCRILNPVSLCLLSEDEKAAGIYTASEHPKQTCWAAMGICSHFWLLHGLDTAWGLLCRGKVPHLSGIHCDPPADFPEQFTEKRSNFPLCIKEALPLHLSSHCSQRGWKGKWVLVLEEMTAALPSP